MSRRGREFQRSVKNAFSGFYFQSRYHHKENTINPIPQNSFYPWTNLTLTLWIFEPVFKILVKQFQGRQGGQIAAISRFKTYLTSRDPCPWLSLSPSPLQYFSRAPIVTSYLTGGPSSTDCPARLFRVWRAISPPSLSLSLW